jgi:hypothetical protein
MKTKSNMTVKESRTYDYDGIAETVIKLCKNKWESVNDVINNLKLIDTTCPNYIAVIVVILKIKRDIENIDDQY